MDTSNKEQDTNIIEASMSVAVFIGYMVTLICCVLLYAVGTFKLIDYPMWYELIYFVGGSVLLIAHFAIRLLMPKQ